MNIIDKIKKEYPKKTANIIGNKKQDIIKIFKI
jgi:hypothetical protein